MSRPAISIFRVVIDTPSRYWGRIDGWGGGTPWERVTGTVWFANDTNDDLSDVVVTIEFFDEHWHRSDGSVDYPVGSLGPKQSTSLQFRWENWQGSRISPRVSIRYTQPGKDGVQRVRWDGYGN
ncbi:MAG: hypothetical protein EB084_07310 [Proteobacteria bacterium]|nr:hypothetical protein [Pseudomonadota bacterium]